MNMAREALPFLLFIEAHVIMKQEQKRRKMNIQKRMIQSILAISLVLVTALASGCQLLTYENPMGERLSRTSLGSNTSISSLTVETDSHGLRRVELHGYQNDSSQALGTVTEAAVRTAIQSAK